MADTVIHRVCLMDDYRTGGSLYLLDSDEETDEVYYTIEIPKTAEYIVYHLPIGFEEEIEPIQIKGFSNVEDACSYAKIQYYLYTGVFPFIVDGYTSSYKSTGKRVSLEVPKGEKCALKKPDVDYHTEYIVISNGEYFEAHSLEWGDEW